MSYTAVLAGEDLKKHMNEQSEGLGINGWWKFQRHFDGWKIALDIVIYMAILVPIVVWIKSSFYPEPADFPWGVKWFIATMISFFIVSGTFIPLIILIERRARGPGTWKKYSVADFTKQYPWPHALLTKYREMRHLDPDSEFTIEVLERKDYAGPQGIVLWQWNLPRKAFLAQETTPRSFPILVLNARNQVVEKMYEG